MVIILSYIFYHNVLNFGINLDSTHLRSTDGKVHPFKVGMKSGLPFSGELCYYNHSSLIIDMLLQQVAVYCVKGISLSFLSNGGRVWLNISAMGFIRRFAISGECILQ